MSGQLTIRRIRSEYRVERDTADPSRIRDACDGALRRHLSQGLKSALARWCDRDDRSVWLVRRLELELAVRTDWDSDELADAFTACIARALATVLSGDGDGASAIRFSRPAAYLSRFLADAATGDAWSRWYYARFEGLRALPTSTAVRTALVDDPQLGLEALQRLGDQELARVVAAMSAHDRRAVLERFAAVTGAAEIGPVLCGAWAAWRQCARAYAEAGARALALFVRAQGAGCGGPALRSAIEALSAAQELAGVLSAPELQAVLAWLSSGEAPETMLGAVPSGQRSRLARAAHVLPLLRAAPPELLAEMFSTAAGATAPADGGSAWTGSTPFGGAFFLLPHLDALDVEAWLAAWPQPESAAAAPAMRLLVLAKCMGGTRAGAALADAILRRVLHVGPDFTLAAARAWLRRAGARRRHALRNAVENAAKGEDVALRLSRDERAQLALPRDAGIPRTWDDALGAAACFVLRRFARRLPGFADSRIAYLHRNFLDVAATLEEEPERLVVRVARPPLHLVLNLTGMTRASYAIRGEARPISVFAQD